MLLNSRHSSERVGKEEEVMVKAEEGSSKVSQEEEEEKEGRVTEEGGVTDCEEKLKDCNDTLET